MPITVDQFNKLIRPLRNRVLNSIARAIVESVDDTKKIQIMKLQLFADEVRTDVERIQNYGFTSVPFSDAEAAVVFPLGNREHGLIIAVDDRKFRLKGLKNGEVALYTDEGDKIHLKRGNVIDIDTKTLNINATEAVNITTKNFKLNASVKIEETSAEKVTTLTAKSTLTAPEMFEIATTKKTVTSPLAEFSGALNSLTSILTPTIAFTTFTASGGTATGTGNLEMTGNLKAVDVEDSVGKLSTLRGVYNSHTHDENGTGGGTTDTPNQTDP